MEDEVRALSQLMDQEVERYRLIADELDKEADCLKKGQIDLLLGVIKKIEGHTEFVHRLQSPIETSIERIFEALGKDGEDKTLSRLAAHLPPVHRTKVKSYQQTLVLFQERVRQMNEKNRTFIQEHLAFLGDLTSWLINPVTETPCYPKAVHPSPVVTPSYAFNKEV
ncbi:MAG: hypothetical protein A2170_10295 [Deltaproteobacteria bacterium RBG_13_53_10]|nr:MAG: hypothetical protein A2170_10295 [Deltaproteobacteria bacterium RBG_13_53_10]